MMIIVGGSDNDDDDDDEVGDDVVDDEDGVDGDDSDDDDDEYDEGVVSKVQVQGAVRMMIIVGGSDNDDDDDVDDNVDEDDEVGLSRHRWIAGSVLIGFWIVLDRCYNTCPMMMMLLMVMTMIMMMMMMTCESVNRVIMADLSSGSSSNLHSLQYYDNYLVGILLKVEKNTKSGKGKLCDGDTAYSREKCKKWERKIM